MQVPFPGQQAGPGNVAAQPPAAPRPNVAAPAAPPAAAVPPTAVGPTSQKPATPAAIPAPPAQNSKEAPKRIVLPLERRSASDAAVKDLDAIADLDFMTDLPDVS
jgi:hypothetical protein